MKQFICLFFLFVTNQVTAQHYDLVLRNGRIVDGTGNAWYRADVAIKDGKIAKIGTAITKSKQIIDVEDKIISPGFIDVHTHVETSLPEIPTADNFIHDGVTTLLTGNCGSSEVDLFAFFSKIETLGISVNVGSLIGHNDVRQAVMKDAMRTPTNEEQKKMEALVTKAMKDGAFGFSTGLIYVPGTYAKTDEVVNLARAAAALGGIYVSHIRSEGSKVKEAIEEAIQVGREAKMPVQISHFKISSKPLWGRSHETIAIVETARQEGIDVTIDQYPYTASSTNLGTMLPSWALSEGDSAIHLRLNDTTIRAKIRKEMLENLTADHRTNFDYAVVARYSPDTTFQGKSITEINRFLGRNETAEQEADLIMDMLDKGFAQMIFHKMSEEDVQFILRYPFTMIASDAGIYALNKSIPHPRGYGSNARVLGRYVRDYQSLKLEDAIRRMTSLPAARFGLKDRGLVQEGYAADLVIFDEKTIEDQATFEQPHAYAKGIEKVLVNGTIVLENGKHTGSRAGKVLRKE